MENDKMYSPLNLSISRFYVMKFDIMFMKSCSNINSMMSGYGGGLLLIHHCSQASIRTEADPKWNGMFV